MRAQLVAPEEVASYRWGSLYRALHERAAGLVTTGWWPGEVVPEVGAQQLQDYARRLIALAKDENAQEAAGVVGLSRGWAIGTAGWRRAVAEEYAQLRINPGLPREEVRELNEAAWAAALAAGLARSGRTLADVSTKRRAAPWKLAIARQLREEAGVPVVWIASALELGKPASVRSYLARGK